MRSPCGRLIRFTDSSRLKPSQKLLLPFNRVKRTAQGLGAGRALQAAQVGARDRTTFFSAIHWYRALRVHLAMYSSSRAIRRRIADATYHTTVIPCKYQWTFRNIPPNSEVYLSATAQEEGDLSAAITGASHIRTLGRFVKKGST